MAKKYWLWKRRKYWYYKLHDEKNWQSTGMTRKADVEAMLESELDKRKAPPTAWKTLKQYAEKYFLWDECLHCLRLREDGRQISPEHAKHQRSQIDESQGRVADLRLVLPQTHKYIMPEEYSWA